MRLRRAAVIFAVGAALGADWGVVAALAIGGGSFAGSIAGLLLIGASAGAGGVAGCALTRR